MNATLSIILKDHSSGSYGTDLTPYQVIIKVLLIPNIKKICKADITTDSDNI